MEAKCYNHECESTFDVNRIRGGRADGARFDEPDDFEPTHCPYCGSDDIEPV